ncbi:hypothetical protein [Lactovum miscens]|uniref:Uncharacterized protein n=1 Tax=Lactovum miscens TaxID=190387 RepID=A0A841C6N3_9LACT|nr:hypothetical protein [Lactovum miscens]MBB5887937.1 hypothetical protein [Lactovum miscens]
MNTKYLVYPDRIRGGISITIEVLIFLGFLSVLIFKNPPILIFVVIIVLLIFFLLMINNEVKKFLKNDLMYEISGNGIKDMTNKDHIIDLSWSEVMKIEEVSNNSSLQIGIFASQNLENHAELAKNVRVNMMRNGNHVFYNILIDGFQFRKRSLQRIWDELKKNAQNANPSIVVIDYVDPILKKRRKK